MARGQSSSKSTVTELDVLKSIDKRLDEIANLLALAAVGNKDQIIQIKLLKSRKLSNYAIGRLLGMSEAGIQKALKRSEKKGRQSRV